MMHEFNQSNDEELFSLSELSNENANDFDENAHSVYGVDETNSICESDDQVDISTVLENELESSQQVNYESDEAAITHLYDGASVAVLEVVAQHFLRFTDHPSISKQALSDILHQQHHSIIPKGNLLPDSYLKAMKIVEHYLVKPIIYEVCPNDCIIFRGNFRIYKLGYVKRGSTVFKVQKDGCGVPSAARTLLGPEGLLMR